MRLKHYLTEARQQLKDWQSYIRRNKELQAAVSILKKINKAGYKAYIVGGSVRDIILGNLKPHDIDIATNMPIDELGKLWKIYDIGKSRDFGIVVAKESGYDFEVAQFRTDGKYADGRRPEKVQFLVDLGSFEKDAERRDFTINAMGINANGDIIDYFDGRRDIKNKVLKTVGDPLKRFGEDYLRMMRLARFSSKLDFDIEPQTKKAAQKLSPNIQGLSVERVREELMKSAAQSGEKFAKYIKILDELKILKHVLPEVMNLKWYRENLHHHPETRGHGGTVFSHVMAALKKSDTKDPLKNLAILLHDVGKGVTFAPQKTHGTPTYYRHAEKSIKLVNAIADRLKLSNNERNALVFAVGNHMKFHLILDMKPAKVAKLVNNDHWDVLTAVGKADEYARGEAFMKSGAFEQIIDKAIKIKEKYGTKEVGKRLKLVDGKHVMAITGMKPGKPLGDVVRRTTEWIMNNDVSDKEKIDDYIRSIAP